MGPERGRTPKRLRRALGEGRACVFHDEFREDLAYWRAHDRAVYERVWRLIEEVIRAPTAGIGKPEHLKALAANVWSRRVTQEDRLVYLVRGDRIDFLQCRYHY